MKTLLFTLFAATAMSNAAVTLQFTITPNAFAGWASGSGATNQLLVWGVLVDSGSELGFANTYKAGFTTASNLNGIALTNSSTSLATDDILFVPTAKMSTGGTFDNSTGLAKITSITNMVYSGNVNAGDKYAIIWFDQLANGVTTENMKYGIYTAPWMTLPADPGTFNVSVNVAGDDPVKTMGYSFVPEPSAALLGALGVLGLLRRRRI